MDGEDAMNGADFDSVYMLSKKVRKEGREGGRKGVKDCSEVEWGG